MMRVILGFSGWNLGGNIFSVVEVAVVVVVKVEGFEHCASVRKIWMVPETRIIRVGVWVILPIGLEGINLLHGTPTILLSMPYNSTILTKSFIVSNSRNISYRVRSNSKIIQFLTNRR